MSYTEITLAPGSNRPVLVDLVGGDGNPADFSVGIWSARLTIVTYPGYTGTPFATLITNIAGPPPAGQYKWLSLLPGSKLQITPDGLVTDLWRFSRQHYDLFITGTTTERYAHGPLKMDW